MRQLLTRWGRDIDVNSVLQEYPREMLRRKNWINLNGYWDYAFTGGVEKEGLLPQGIPEKWDGQILVPFSPESVLSKVSRQLLPHELLWYRRFLPELSERKEGHRILIHFGAVDQACIVYINGREAGRHIGGYLPFDLDITDFLKPVGSVQENGDDSCDEIAEEKASSRFSEEEGTSGGRRRSVITFFPGVSSQGYHGDRDEEEPEDEDEASEEFLSDEEQEGAASGCFDEIVVCVRDVSDTSWHARGKQKLKNGGMFYTATSGIWQTVWMEEVPADYIRGIETVADPDNGYINILVKADGDFPVRVCVRNPDLYVSRDRVREDDGLFRRAVVAGMTNTWLNVRIAKPKLWTFEEPWLYHFDVEMGEDRATSYFAMRSITLENDERDIPRIYLNHEQVFLRGVLDQGYWPDGIYTAPSDEAMLFDLREMKKSGFNMVRKHAKIEPDRWYYHCDCLGLLVWQDIVNGGETYQPWFVTYAATLMNWLGVKVRDIHPSMVGRMSESGREEFRREIVETAEALRFHPCIFAWTLFNEAWGQFETERCTKILRKADPEHLIDAASGWFDQKGGDFRSIHFYYLTFKMAVESRRAFVLSEFGGLPYYIPEHSSGERIYGYGRNSKTREDLNRKYRKLIRDIERRIPKGLCATVYTQWTDIEDEVNGIFTCDREIKKIVRFGERAMGEEFTSENGEEMARPPGLTATDMAAGDAMHI